MNSLELEAVMTAVTTLYQPFVLNGTETEEVPGVIFDVRSAPGKVVSP